MTAVLTQLAVCLLCKYSVLRMFCEVDKSIAVKAMLIMASAISTSISVNPDCLRILLFMGRLSFNSAIIGFDYLITRFPIFITEYNNKRCRITARSNDDLWLASLRNNFIMNFYGYF